MTIQEIKKIINSEEYAFLKENDSLGENIILLGLGGSYAYGTNTETSDLDIRGIAINRPSEIFGVNKDFEQVIETNTDTTIYSLQKMVKLLVQCNPNTIEILGLHPEHYLYTNKYGEQILNIKQAFLSKIAIDRFGGYAREQYNRLEHGLLGNGANDEKKMAMLKHSLECVLEAFNIKHQNNQINMQISIITKENNQEQWNKMRHTDKAELYGEDLVISGSLRDYPITEFKTIISEIHKAQSSYGNLNKRNTKKTGAKLSKHMMHLIRLYLMGIDLNRECKIKTYREGKEHELLMAIRNGKYMYNDEMRVKPEFYDILHDIQNEYQESLKNTTLPDKPNSELINETLLNIYKDKLEKERT